MRISTLSVVVAMIILPTLPTELATQADEGQVQVNIELAQGTRIEVTDPVLSDPNTRDKFDVKIEPVDTKDLPNKAAKKGVRITLTAKPGLPVGRFVEWLSVKTSLKDAESLEIPVVGQIVGDISVAEQRQRYTPSSS